MRTLGGQSAIFAKARYSILSLACGQTFFLPSKPNIRLSGVVDRIGFGTTPDPNVFGRLEPGLPDAQRTLNWVHLASRFPVRVRVQNPPPELFRVGESAVVEIRGH
jgi:membrane fusion protein, multidrug efflux system